MKKKFLNYPGYKWILILLFLIMLIIAVFIYYNRRIKIIDNELNRISLYRSDLRSLIRG